MSARWLFAAALVVVLAVSAAVLVGGRRESSVAAPPPKGGAAAGSDPSRPTGESAKHPIPGLPPRPIRLRSNAPPAPPPSDPVSDEFAAEERDAGWARDTEKLIHERVSALLAGEKDGAVEVTAIERKSRHCRLSVRGADGTAFEHFIDSLQDERGFLGVAQQLMLLRLERGAGGSRSVQVLLRFSRDEESPQSGTR